jgi:hypothetical protein
VVQVWTKRPLPIGNTIVRSQVIMELGPEDLVEKLTRQGFIETIEAKEAREKAAKEAATPKKEPEKEPEKKHKKPEKSG